MTLTAHDMESLVALRHALHRHPELSGDEHATAKRIVNALDGLGAEILTGLGGTGVAAVFDSGQPGPSVMFRAELDALPINEIGTSPWRSAVKGRGHLCGHDGHMAILTGLARVLARNTRRAPTGFQRSPLPTVCAAAADGDTVEFAHHDLGKVSRDGSVWRNLAVQTDRFSSQVPRASTPCCP